MVLLVLFMSGSLRLRNHPRLRLLQPDMQTLLKNLVALHSTLSFKQSDTIAALIMVGTEPRAASRCDLARWENQIGQVRIRSGRKGAPQCHNT